MIAARNITKKFGEHVLFDHLDFVIEDGEFVCFSGPSGKGKTTLLHIIGLIEPVDEGEILIDGQALKKNREKRKFFSEKVGFLFQNFALIENKTVKENLELIREKSRTSYTIEEVLERVGMADKADRKVFTLSGGEQQRVALARLFLKKCSIILADEPTGSLDAKNAEIVMKILMELNKSGKTVILVTHDEKIKKIAGRVMEL